MKKAGLANKIKSSGVVGLTSLTAVLATAGSAHAQVNPPPIEGGPSSLEDVVQRVINILLYVVGVAAVVMMIIGGIRYIVSGGDQQAVTNAKNTILYSIVGLVVAMLAYVVVQYVFNQVSGA